MNGNQKIRNFAKSVPGGSGLDLVARKLTYHFFYKNHLKSNSIAEEKLLILGTIARSGTHYAMLLLTNYINSLAGSDNPVGPVEMNDILPNNWHLNYMSYHKLPLGPLVQNDPKMPNELVRHLQLDEITRSHSLFQPIYWQNSQILHLYRNPLDYAVSLFNYKHKKRSDIPDRCSDPNEVLELKFENYCNMYTSYRNASKNGKYRILRISYENLIQNPAFYLNAIITWLGNEPNEHLVQRAVESSSINKVQRAEKMGGEVNPTAKGLKGSFISSGQIGQWKEFFTPEDFDRWNLRFRERGIELDGFILE